MLLLGIFYFTNTVPCSTKQVLWAPFKKKEEPSPLYIQAGHIYNRTLCFSGLFMSLVPGEIINEQEERAWALPLGIQDRGWGQQTQSNTGTSAGCQAHSRCGTRLETLSKADLKEHCLSWDTKNHGMWAKPKLRPRAVNFFCKGPDYRSQALVGHTTPGLCHYSQMVTLTFYKLRMHFTSVKFHLQCWFLNCIYFSHIVTVFSDTSKCKT